MKNTCISFISLMVVSLLFVQDFDLNAQIRHVYGAYPSNRFITSMAEDRDGYIWMSSMRGLNRYDGTVYLTFYASNEEGGLDNDYVYDVCPDSKGNVWLGTKAGVNCYREGRFVAGGSSLVSNPVARVLELDDEHILATGRYGIMKINKESFFEDGSLGIESEYQTGNNSWVSLITVSGEGDVWYAMTDGGKSSITILDRNLALRDSISLPEVDFIHTITSGLNHSVWISTFQNGLLSFDETSGRQLSVPAQVDELVGKRGWVQFIEKYSDTSCLIGVYGKGMYLYDFREDTLRHIYPDEVLRSPYYRCMVDTGGNIWLTDNVSEVKCYPPETHYSHYSPIENNTGYIRQIMISPEGKFFFGTEIHYFSYDPNSDDVRHLINCYGFFTSELLDSRGDLWLSSGRDVVYRYSVSGLETSLVNTYQIGGDVNFLCEDSIGNVWIFSSNSAVYITPDGRMVNYGNVRDLQRSTVPVSDHAEGRIFLNTTSGDIYECTISGIEKTGFALRGLTCALTASDGSIWLGTSGDGLYCYDGSTGEEKLHLREGESLYDGNIKAILEDGDGNIWFSTTNYITRLDPRSLKVNNIFDSVFEDSGFYEVGCAAIDKEGNMYFGGNVGYTKIASDAYNFDLTPKGTRLLLQEVAVGGEELPIIPEKLVVPRKRSNISFRYVAPNYGGGPKMLYSYMMESLDRDWTSSSENYVKYTNLRAGHYNFRVRMRLPDGTWDSDEIILPIRVKPYLLGSTGAILLYIIVTLAFLYMLFSLIVRTRVQQERISLIEAKEELERERMEFMTNISHEFRTPLSLVYGPLKQLLSSGTFHPADKSALELMERNVVRLRDMSEKILDASSGKMTDRLLKVSAHDPEAFIKDISEYFRYASSQKDIDFTVESLSQETIYFDRDKVEKICYNLLSNAFKYTPEHGKVHFRINVLDGKAEFGLRITAQGFLKK